MLHVHHETISSYMIILFKNTQYILQHNQINCIIKLLSKQFKLFSETPQLLNNQGETLCNVYNITGIYTGGRGNQGNPPSNLNFPP